MLGTLVNAAAIAICGAAGAIIGTGIRDRFREIAIQALSLCVLLLGTSTALGGLAESRRPLLFILSLVIGGLIGEGINIEKRLETFGARLRGVMGGSGGFSEGFVAASLLFCVGSMAIVGSLRSGLQGDHAILFAKSILDGVGALFLASTYGAGVILSAAPVLLYQGAITLMAAAVAPFATNELLGEVSIVGGLLIFGIGLNLMGLKKIRIANLLPAMLGPVIYFLPFVQKFLNP